MSVEDTVLEDFLLINREEVRWMPTHRVFAGHTNLAKVLVFLHAANGRFVLAQDIAEFIWPWAHPRQKIVQVQIHISDLRRNEKIPIVGRHGHGYALRVDERY